MTKSSVPGPLGWTDTPYGPVANYLFGKGPTVSEATTRAILAAAKPKLPEKEIPASTDYVKIATSNLFMSSQPTVSVDEITTQLFYNISSKELIGLTSNDAVYKISSVPSYNNNVVNTFEVSQTYNSKTILSLNIPISKTSNVLSGSSSSITNTQAIITSPSVSSSIKGQIQVITVPIIKSGTVYP
jgi:hypothetical protein